MAHAIQTNVLLDALLTDITKLSPSGNARKLRRHREYAIKVLKPAQHARVNQFEVINVLQGLTEKFLVLNREDLSTALAGRLRALEAHADKWTPEVLSLLLALSDRPVEQPLHRVDRLRSAGTGEPPLTWGELLKDDPVSDEELWQNMDYSPVTTDSEDSTLPSLEEDKPHRSWRAVASTKDEPQSTTYIVQIDQSALLACESLERETQCTSPVSKVHPLAVSELQAVREVLLAVRGIPSTLFKESADGLYHFKQAYGINGASNAAVVHIMGQMASIASRLGLVRLWISDQYRDPLWQSFTAVVQKEVLRLDRFFSTLEEDLVPPREAAIVSIMSAAEQIRRQSMNVLFLQQFLAKLSPEKGPFDHLELLYDLVCSEQASGQLDRSQFLLNLFLDNLRLFLDPIEEWMVEGVIRSDISPAFFVMELPGLVDRSCIWSDRFHFRSINDQSLAFPSFIQASAHAILTAGKTVFYLKQLGLTQEIPDVLSSNSSFPDCCDSFANLSLTPFPDFFAQAFDKWIARLHGSAPSLLKQQLMTTHNLPRALKGLQEVYLCLDDIRSQNIAASCLYATQRQKTNAGNRYVLLDRIRSVFAGCATVDPSLMSIRLISGASSNSHSQGDAAWLIEYNLPWPIMNVIQRRSISLYQQLFSLLMRLHRARYTLRSSLFIRSKSARNRKAIGLRHGLQWAVDIFSCHFFQIVIHPACTEVNSSICHAQDMDALIKVHQRFIDRINKQCLLTPNLQPVLQSMISILSLADRLRACLSYDLEQDISDCSLRRLIRRPMNSKFHRSQRRETASETSNSSTEESDMEDAYEADTENLQSQRQLSVDNIGTIREEFDRLCSQVIVALRGISRAAGETTWGMLADKLDWKMSGHQHNSYD